MNEVSHMTGEAHVKFHVSAFLIYRLPSIQSTTISYSLVCHLGSAFKALLLTGLGPICPLAVFVSNAITTSPLYTLVSVVSPKAQFLALYSLSCTQPRSVL